MESKVVVLLGLCVILGFATALDTPYSLSGHVYDNSSNPLVGVNIKLTNMNSTDIIYATSTSGGEYQQDAANFALGYNNSNIIQYYCTYGVDSVTYNTSIDTSGGGTLLDMYMNVTLNVTLNVTPTTPVDDIPMTIGDFVKDIMTPIYSFFVILIIAAFAGVIIYIIKYGVEIEQVTKLAIGFALAVLLLVLALYIGEVFSSF